MIKNKNIYMPFKAIIKNIVDIGRDVRLFQIILPNPLLSTGRRGGFADYVPGQFFMVSIWGSGEVPISITSTKGLQKHIELGIKKVGMVTTSLHKLKKGDTLWLRGPYGNGFRTDTIRGKNIVFVAGGIGIVHLRSLINYILMHKKQYGKLFLLYGSKKPSEILFENDLRAWDKKGIEIILTVDTENKTWKGDVGLVTEHIDKLKTDFKNACAFICGTELMIEKTMKELSASGIPEKHITTTLEARMKCGIGKCGQCYHGTEYICTNGPVFTYEEIKKRKIYGP